MANRKRNKQSESEADEALHYPAPQPMPENPPPLNPAPEHTPSPDYLKGIRARYMNVRTDTARIIGELQAHRDEIDATIAFLKAHQR